MALLYPRFDSASGRAVESSSRTRETPKAKGKLQIRCLSERYRRNIAVFAQDEKENEKQRSHMRQVHVPREEKPPAMVTPLQNKRAPPKALSLMVSHDMQAKDWIGNFQIGEIVNKHQSVRGLFRQKHHNKYYSGLTEVRQRFETTKKLKYCSAYPTEDKMQCPIKDATMVVQKRVGDNDERAKTSRCLSFSIQPTTTSR